MRILCRLRIHSWIYQAKNTGIYLHTWADGSLPMPKDYYTGKKKCDYCGKEGS